MRKVGETLTAYDYEYAAAGRGVGDGKAEARAFSERWQRDRTKAADLARFELEEVRSRARRAARAQTEQLLRESRALIAAADRRFDAPLTDQGQIFSAIRRGGLR